MSSSSLPVSNSLCIHPFLHVLCRYLSLSKRVSIFKKSILHSLFLYVLFSHISLSCLPSISVPILLYLSPPSTQSLVFSLLHTNSDLILSPPFLPSNSAVLCIALYSSLFQLGWLRNSIFEISRNTKFLRPYFEFRENLRFYFAIILTQISQKS